MPNAPIYAVSTVIGPAWAVWKAPPEVNEYRYARFVIDGRGPCFMCSNEYRGRGTRIDVEVNDAE